MFYVVAVFLVGILLYSAWLISVWKQRSAAYIVELHFEKEELERSIELTREERLQLVNQLEGLNAQLTKLKETLELQDEELRSLTRQVAASVPRRQAYLTFDDGPSNNTVAILDLLKEYNIKATFFVCGNNTSFGKEVYKRIVDEGHALGNHSYSHNYSRIFSSREAFWEDFMRLEELLYESTGIRSSLMRFPGGSNNTVSIQYGGQDLMAQLCEDALKKGYNYFDWSVSSLDSTVAVQETQVIVDAVLSRVRGMVNPVILFHDSSARTTTVEALPIIIEGLRELGYDFDALTADVRPVRFK